MSSIVTASVSVIVFAAAIASYLFYGRTRKKHSKHSVSNSVDSIIKHPDYILRSSIVNLIGRPAALMMRNDVVIPIAVVASDMSYEKLEGYTMQLMAYCLLVEEKYGKKPPGGILRHDDQEMKIAYTKEAKTAVIDLVKEIEKNKKANTEFFCDHPEHNL